MKTNAFLILSLLIFTLSCSKTVNYSEEHIKNTSGRYLYNHNEVIDVFYEDNQLYIKWKGAEMEPVIIDEEVFFVVDMYAKLHFVQHPETGERYLSKIPEENTGLISYDYLKVSDTFKTPRMYLNERNYNLALSSYLELKKQDSTFVLAEERELNRLGYTYLGNNETKKAIEAFKMNVALYPESSNVYDSLGDAYVRNGDSLLAYTNYKKAYEMDNGYKNAKRYIDAYDKKHN